MSDVASGERRSRCARIAHNGGNVAWWVFVVGRLLSESGHRYGEFSGWSVFGLRKEYGWTAYSPLTDRSMPSAWDAEFVDVNVIAVEEFGALVLVLVAAITEAVALGRWPAGGGTIAAPAIGAAIILAGISGHLGVGRLGHSLLVTFILVLLGAGVREMWSRVLAPR